MKSRAETYRQNALGLQRAARCTLERELKSEYLELAQQWLELAREAQSLAGRGQASEPAKALA
jgi:short subunit dehydrogenase-like uncharacterized protein